jgi:hypothetical protein
MLYYSKVMLYYSDLFQKREQKWATSLHLQAARRVPKFHPHAAVRLLSDINPWRPDLGQYGHRFFEEVLRPNPISTVGKLEALRRQLGHPRPLRSRARPLALHIR